MPPSRAAPDFLVLGTIFETTDPSRSADGWSRHLSKRSHTLSGIPVLGIGGITPANVRSVIDAGASGAAVITAISLAQDPAAATDNLHRALTGSAL